MFQHLFWIYSHPAVYIMILPAMGIVTEIFPTFSQKPVFGYGAIAISSLAIAFAGYFVSDCRECPAGISIIFPNSRPGRFFRPIVYTSLKRVTVLAVLPGALVGALPPLIGYASAGGLCPGWEIVTFAAFMFLWQIIHFLLIAIRYESDYRKAGFKIVSPFKNAFFLMFADKKRFRPAFLILNFISIAVMTGFIINSFISAA